MSDDCGLYGGVVLTGGRIDTGNPARDMAHGAGRYGLIDQRAVM